MKYFIFCLILPFFSTVLFAQSYAEQYAFYINKEELKQHIYVLASDSLEGRATGYIGQQKTSDYLISQFKKDNLTGPKGYTDMRFPYKVVEITPSGELNIGNNEFQYYKDFMFFGIKSTLNIENKQVLFISDYISEETGKEVDVKNKIVVLQAGNEKFDYESLQKNTKKYEENGAAAIIYMTSFYKELSEYFEDFAHHKTMRLATDSAKTVCPLIISKPEIINSIGLSGRWERKLTKNKPIKKPLELASASIVLNNDTTYLNTENVVAFIEGGEKKEEILILTAHMDHLGTEDGLVFNGADDNATGTAALLEIGQAFQLAKKDGHTLKRSLLIMPVSGEEKGLLGSRYYSENPIFPLDKTIADLNIDMIGRTDIRHNQPNYVYIIGSNMISDDLHDANEKANEQYVGLELDYTYNTKDDPNRYYYRSDHYNFVKHGIPSIFYFSGVHEDYHKATDTPDKINYEKVETVTKLVFFTAWELLNAESAPQANEE